MFYNTIENKKKAIFTTIDENRKISYNQLKRIICDEKEVMSERPFRELLKEMVAEKLILRVPEGTQNVFYYAGNEFFEAEKNVETHIEKHLYIIDEKFQKLEKHYKKLDAINQAASIAAFCLLLFYLKYKIAIVEQVAHNSKIRKLSQQLNDYGVKILDFVQTKSSEPFKIFDLVDSMFASHAQTIINSMDEVLTDKINNKNQQQNQRESHNPCLLFTSNEVS